MKMSNKSNETRLKRDCNRNLNEKRKQSSKRSKMLNVTIKIKLKTLMMKTKRP